MKRVMHGKMVNHHILLLTDTVHGQAL